MSGKCSYEYMCGVELQLVSAIMNVWIGARENIKSLSPVHMNTLTKDGRMAEVGF